MKNRTFIVKGKSVWVIDIKPLSLDELKTLGLIDDDSTATSLLWQQYKDNQDFRSFAIDLMDFLKPHLSLAEKKEMLLQLTSQLIKTCPIDEGLSIKTAVDRLAMFIDDAQKYEQEVKRDKGGTHEKGN